MRAHARYVAHGNQDRLDSRAAARQFHQQTTQQQHCRVDCENLHGQPHRNPVGIEGARNWIVSARAPPSHEQRGERNKEHHDRCSREQQA